MKFLALLAATAASAVAAAAADPNCSVGILSADRTVCCPAACGQCGGGDCNSRPGGRDNCCELAIKASNVTCEAAAAPCALAPAPAPPPPTGLRFATSYGDHMVLQQAPARAVVWGHCGAAGCDGVQVSLDGGAAVAAGVGGPAGTWIAKLPATEGGGAAHTVEVSDSSGANATLTDVLFGDVWVCSGQSNMAFLLENAFNGSAYVNASGSFPQLRMFTSKKDSLPSAPQYEQPQVEEVWATSSPAAVSMNQAGVDDDDWLYMSAVCYLYGVEIHKRTGKPVGLVNTNWGGTPVEFWMSSDALASCPKANAGGAAMPDGGAYNGMIQPLLNMTIYGAIWYQGEANGGDPLSEQDFQGLPLSRYGCTFPAMIRDWRAKWHEGSLGETSADFYFGFVQLASWISDIHPASTRWGQLGGYPGLPNPVLGNHTFDAIALDLTDRTSPYGSVHIRDKTTVAQRLAAGGLAVAYGQKEYWQGPVAVRAEISNYNRFVNVYFSNCGAEGLDVGNNSGWALCLLGGKNNCSQASNPVSTAVQGEWVVAEGASGAGPTATWVGVDTVGTGWPALAKDAADGQVLVRYGWAGLAFEYKQAAVYAKKEGFPAGPFVLQTRTKKH